MEKITQINDLEVRGDYSGQSGYEIVTSKQRIKLLIDNGQSCCENWGYFWCNDDVQSFVGADLQSVKLTDAALNDAHMKANDLDPTREYFEGGVMFVNIETSRGTLQFVAYNQHNGYYGHTAVVECKQLSHSESL
jgi:hypothetical protein